MGFIYFLGGLASTKDAYDDNMDENIESEDDEHVKHVTGGFSTAVTPFFVLKSISIDLLA
jgi:hypothetical protein